MELTSSFSLIEHRSLSLLGLPTTVIGLPGYWANKTMMLAPGGSGGCGCGSSGHHDTKTAAERAYDKAVAREQKKRAKKIKTYRENSVEETKVAVELYRKWVDDNTSVVIQAALVSIQKFLRRKLMIERRRKANIYRDLLGSDVLSEERKLLILFALLKSKRIGQLNVGKSVAVELLTHGTEGKFIEILTNSIEVVLYNGHYNCLRSEREIYCLKIILCRLLPEVVWQIMGRMCQDNRVFLSEIEKNVIRPIISKVKAMKDPENDFDDVLDELNAVFPSDSALNKTSKKASHINYKEIQRHKTTGPAVESCVNWIEANAAKVMALAQEGIKHHFGAKRTSRFFRKALWVSKRPFIYEELFQRGELSENVKCAILYALLLYPKRTPGKLQNNVAHHVIAAFKAENPKMSGLQGRIKSFPAKFLVEVFEHIVMNTVADQKTGLLQHYVRVIAILINCAQSKKVPERIEFILRKINWLQENKSVQTDDVEPEKQSNKFNPSEASDSTHSKSDTLAFDEYGELSSGGSNDEGSCGVSAGS